MSKQTYRPRRFNPGDLVWVQARDHEPVPGRVVRNLPSSTKLVGCVTVQLDKENMSEWELTIVATSMLRKRSGAPAARSEGWLR